MTIRTPSQAVAAARATKRNIPRMCQAVTRNWFNAPSVGDVDGDGAADAEDGWKSEPAHAKHTGDRHPPAGYPVYYGQGSLDNGHRAISLGEVNGRWMIRSTDAAGTGFVGDVPLSYPEDQWNMPYVGWSETISGLPIPSDHPVVPAVKPHPPTRVSKARALLKDAEAKAAKRGQKKRAALLKKARKLLPVR